MGFALTENHLTLLRACIFVYCNNRALLCFSLSVLRYLVPFKVDGTIRTVGRRSVTYPLNWFLSEVFCSSAFVIHIYPSTLDIFRY